MKSSKCTHIRIRDNNDYDLNVHRFLESVEKEFNIDFTSFPRWEELVQRLHVASTDCKRKIQDAKLRKALIIDKLYMQSTRPSPFDLTTALCRTQSKWRQIESDLKKRKVSLEPAVTVTPLSPPEILEEEDEEDDSEIPNLHPNTENLSSRSPPELDLSYEPVKQNAEVQVDTQTDSHLPYVIYTNPHKLISPLESKFSGLSYKSLLVPIKELVENEKEDSHYLKLTSSVICTPKELTISNDSLKQQSIQFSVTNCTGEYMHIRFKGVTDSSHFKKTKLLPAIPKRLYPGVPVVYKFIFNIKLQKNFKSGLNFKVGRIVYDNMPSEGFHVPIITAFTIKRSVSVTDTVQIPPIYSWHLTRDGNYSSGIIRITVDDPYRYHLHIRRKIVDLAEDFDNVMSLQASGPNTDSLAKRAGDEQVDAKTIASSIKTDATRPEYQSITYIDEITVIANDMIQLALDTFMLESTYLFLQPYSKVKIPVYFTKMEHIGCHQSYYDFDFIDPETDKVIFTRTCKIFAEILPHPIQIQPVILDMSQSPVCHGYCEDHFTVYNNHKIYPCYTKIKLTTKMKKMFYVEPMEAVVPTLASVPFAVKFCSRDFLAVHPSEDLVHFTFKIVVNGYKAVYENVPRFFYEVIAPCAVEFKKVYNEKYFKDDEEAP